MICLKGQKNILVMMKKIYIYQCKKCKKYDPVPGFVVGEQLGFLKFSKQKISFEMQCPYCGGKSYPIDTD